MKLQYKETIGYGHQHVGSYVLPRGTLQSDFEALRAQGARANEAFRCAKTFERWRELESEGRVRVLYVPDDDPSAALDWLNQSAEEMHFDARAWEAIQKSERKRAEYHGVWGLVVQTRENSVWVQGDAIWGFVGEDGLDVVGYFEDFARSAAFVLENNDD